MPEWRKVESPITATTFWRTPAFSIPSALPMLAPMQPVVSMASSGGRHASV